MDMAHKDLLIARISCGFLRCNINNNFYILTTPSNQTKYIANELYKKIYEDCLFSDMYFQEDMFDILIQEGIWDENKETRLDGLKKDVDEIKLKLFQVTLNERDNYIVRTQLSKAKTEIEDLEYQRHCYDHVTAEGVALMARQRFLIGCSLKYEDGKNYWENSDNWDNPDGLIDKIMELSTQNRIIESEYREIARTDPWTRTWSTCKNPKDIFGVNIIDLNDEQKTLLAWSILYDNVMEHPERPSEDVIEDDDRLDGWMIYHRKQRDKDNFKRKIAQKTSNPNIANAQEVYVMPDTYDEISKIDDLNEGISRIMKSKRMAALKEKGQLHELEMPDTKIRLLNAIKERYG